MHLDYLLFIIGIITCVSAIVLTLCLVSSKKRSKLYQDLLRQDTERIDAYSLTISQLLNNKSEYVEETESLRISNEYETTPLNSEVTALLQDEATERSKYYGLDLDILENKYIINREIHGGGMSRIFLVTNTKLGNQWILKYIDKKNGQLANEENILKLLNNINLPKIIDIFKDDNGTYIVQSYIEGISLDKIIDTKNNIGQTMTLEWAEQLAGVLSYLHALKPLPIIHCDLKPSNIMVTPDNKLVLIDFGISKQLAGFDDEVMAVTYKYAAPEQLKHNISGKQKELINERFGELTNERFSWGIDEKTDIYSYGVILFQLVTGAIPTYKNKNMIKEFLSKEFADIIIKCIEENPDKRYQNTYELLDDLYKIKNTRTTMVRSLVLRRVATSLSIVSLLVSGSSFASGAYVMQQEKLSLLVMEPDMVKLTEQQYAEISIQKVKPNGKIITIPANEIKWSLNDKNIARIEGNRIAGLNSGSTELLGKYRNKIITLNVDVVKRINGLVDISLCYKNGNEVQKYLGTGEREHIDGDIDIASFVSPESIAKTENGTIYISDSGILRKIQNSNVESIYFEPSYITPRILRTYRDELFILSNPWEDDEGYHYGIVKLNNDGVEGLYVSDAIYTDIEDFALNEEGLIYFIENNTGTGISAIKSLNPDSSEVVEICEIENGVKAMTLDTEGNIYLAISERGIIQKFDSTTKEIKYFAGVDGKRHFIDGSLPLLYEPIKLHYENESLYVLDFNIIRKINIEDGVVSMVETLAGEVSTDINPETIDGSAHSVVFAKSSQKDFLIDDSTILLTDPKKSCIWKILLQ